MKTFGQSSGTRIELEPREAVELAAKLLRHGDWGIYPVRLTIDSMGEVWTAPSKGET